MPTLSEMDQLSRAGAAFKVAQEISQILDTGLESETLSILIKLVEAGVNPEALAAVVKELQREAASLKAAVGQAKPARS